MPSHPDYVLELEDAHLHKLTNMLALPPHHGTAQPSSKWLAAQARAVPNLPKPVLRPSKLLPRLAVKLSEATGAPALPPAAVLCAAHRGLHPWLVRAVFNLLAAEVTMRCDRLRKYVSKLDSDEETARKVSGILSSVNKLWLDEAHFERLFGGQALGWKDKLERVEDGCEACVLAAVGSRGELLAALRAHLLGRKRGEEPRLLRVVESWIGWFGEAERGTLRMESDELMKGVKVARRATRKKKHRKGAEGREKTCSPWLEAIQGQGRETPSVRSSSETKRSSHGDSPNNLGLEERADSPVREEQIADWYARSELELGARVPTRSIHPAFQPSNFDLLEEDDESPRGGRESNPHMEKENSTHGGYTSILDCYGDDTQTGRKTSWTTCTVHTSQTPHHNPPPPPLPFPTGVDDTSDAETEVVRVHASSSIYSGTEASTSPLSSAPGFDVRGREWRSVKDPATSFRNPFVRGHGSPRVVESPPPSPGARAPPVSVRTVPLVGGWI